MQGLMQDWPLTVDRLLDHAAHWHGGQEVVTRSVEGPIGRATTGDVRSVPDDRLREMGRGLPLVRIRPTGIGSGPADPGGFMWVPVQAAAALGTLWLGSTKLLVR